MAVIVDDIFGYPLIHVIVVLLVVYFLVLAVYRLYLSPLAAVPGPRIAALTGWYEFYWDCPKQGHFMFKIEEMHRNYGPIVRINPWEVHINDPAYWDTLYRNKKLDKDAWYYRAFGDNGAAVGTGPSDLHRARRGAMAKYFSTASVSKLEPKVLARVKKLCDRVEELRDAGAVIDISNAYRCFATDVVSSHAAPHAREFLSSPDFAASFNRVLRDFSELMLWHRHFPIVFPVMELIPKKIISWMDPTGANIAVLENQASLLNEAETVIKRKGIPVDHEPPTVLDAIYTSPLLGSEEKTLTRLMAETQALLGAGTETTGNTLSVFTFHVLSNRRILQFLKSELQEAAVLNGVGDFFTYRMLEKLPYLQACIKEALRLSSGVSARLPRVNPYESMSYTAPTGTTYIFPPGTVMSMSTRDLHLNGDIFHDPDTFAPERWINGNENDISRMEKSFVPFSSGSRSCLGLELAKEELALMAGNLIYKFDLELFETSARDVSIQHDYFAPFGPKDSKGVRVVAKQKC